METFLTTRLADETYTRFCESRLSEAHLADALAAVTRATVERALADVPQPTVLKLRDAAEALWRSLRASEARALAHAPPFDAAPLVARLRELSDGAARRQLVADTLVDAVRRGASLELRDASLAVHRRAAADLVAAWERDVLHGGGDVRTPSGVVAVASATASACYKSPLGAPKAELAELAAELGSRSAPLTVADLRELCRRLQTSSVTGALSFAFHATEGDWEAVFLTPPRAVVAGPPARLREARPWTPDDSGGCSVNPAATAPKAEGGALPPPQQFLYTVGRGAESGAHVALGDTVLAKGGGLLASLPGTARLDADGTARARYLRVDPDCGIATVLEVAAASGGAPKATSVLRLQLYMPTASELEGVGDDDGSGGGGEGDTTSSSGGGSGGVIDWVDAQRDWEGNLVIVWGGRNNLTGGVTWASHKGLKDAWAKGEDPFLELDDAEVDDMFATRCEHGAAADFRDHGNLVTAHVRQVEEETPRGRFLSPVTSVLYNDVLLAVLPGVQAIAAWGTPHAFVVWTHDGRGVTLRGAATPDDVEMRTAVTARAVRVPAEGVASIAPWWWPLN